MDDPYPQAGTKGPRCSFCGRAADDASEMVRGPDAYICSSCIEDAAVIMDGDVRGHNDDEPEPVDWQSAYSYLQSSPPPIVDLLRKTYRQDSELYWLACRIRQCRKATDLDHLEDIVQMAVAKEIHQSFRSHHTHQ